MPQTEQEQLSNWQWLTSDSGRSVCRQLGAMGDDPLRIQKWLRKQGVSVERAALVMEQWTLKAKAREKFPCLDESGTPLADRMFFRSQLLQQSTAYSLAKWKARRFSAAPTIADICCGLGGDLLALANCNENVEATGIDRSEVACHLAETNCQAAGLRVSIVCDSAENAKLAEDAWFHIDPDRRIEGNRTTTIDQFSPSLKTLDHLLDSHQNGAIKLAPATDIPEHWWDRCERQWVGDATECKQAMTWFGETSSQHGCRSAAAVDQNGATIFEWTESPSLSEKSGRSRKFAKAWGSYLYEPHATLIAGRMVDSLALELGLAKPVSDVAYLTGSKVEFKGMTAYQVIEDTRMDESAVVEALLRLDCGPLEVKKRGLDYQHVDRFAKAVRARLKKRASGQSAASTASTQPLVLVLTRMGSGYTAVIARRLS